jgi:hypothetical protein
VHITSPIARLLAAAVALVATVAVASGARPAQRAAVEVEPIHRLEITIRTAARSARLLLRAPATLIVADPKRVSRGADVDPGRFGRGPLRLNGGGSRSTARFVVALTPGASERVRFALSHQGGGPTTVRIENLNGDRGGLIRQLVHRGPGERRFAVPTQRVAARGPAPDTEPLPPEVYAFYYMWYEMGDWSGGKPIAEDNDNPQPYASDDPAAIDRHIQQAQQAGLDGFLASWLGRGTQTDERLQLLEERLPDGFRFAAYVETQFPAFQTEQGLIDELDYLLDTYASSDNYVRFRGRPVIYAFATRHLFQGEFGLHPNHLRAWRRILGELAERGHQPYLIGEGRHFEPDNYEVFHGMHAYGTPDPDRSFEFNRKRELVARAWAAVHGGPRRIYAASVIPGYDDRHIERPQPTYYFPREDGALYASQWAAATDTASDQALVVSFNEWMETSNIEPNEQWGETYLDLTAQHAAAFRESR